LVPYLEALGITDLYASPLLAARPGSPHGYDITDPARLNPALGSEEEFTALAAELRRRGMGLLLDIVPNHTAASSENPWWADVLKNGPQSPCASFFDLDWKPEGVPGLAGQVLEGNLSPPPRIRPRPLAQHTYRRNSAGRNPLPISRRLPTPAGAAGPGPPPRRGLPQLPCRPAGARRKQPVKKLPESKVPVSKNKATPLKNEKAGNFCKSPASPCFSGNSRALPDAFA
ncbi:MAG: alpha-amylase family glycosyl hydrolase, partial [Desulfotomaculales bacterium]